jgi:hypothetical protein
MNFCKLNDIHGSEIWINLSQIIKINSKVYGLNVEATFYSSNENVFTVYFDNEAWKNFEKILNAS